MSTIQDRTVYGVDHKVDRLGRPIEQGRGSAKNQTVQSIEAYRRPARMSRTTRRTSPAWRRSSPRRMSGGKGASNEQQPRHLQ